jgi:16S rRNA C1402 N4-methylase RsmH
MHFDTEIFRTSDKEILKEVERQIKENRKNELLRNTKQLTEISEENNSKKNRRKAMKEMVMCLERIQLS